jgi:predicted flap endonuclease-1-like 5' DNA nuclease
MIAFIGEVIGCLIVAAGIGGITGWLLRHVSVRSLNRHNYELTTMLQAKEQALHSAQLEIKAKASSMQIYESKLAASEALIRSTQDELAARTERLATIQHELTGATQRISTLEAERSASLQRFNDSDAIISAFEQEARQANAARTAAQQALSQKEEDLFELQQRAAEMEEALAETDRLKALVAELEPAQGRVHWLEVQLSEKDVQYRAALHENDEHKAALALRTNEAESLQRQCQQYEESLQGWESKYSLAIKQQKVDAERLETQRARMQEIQHTVADREQLLKDKDAQVAALQQQLDELCSLQQAMGKQEEEISRLRKRLVEVRAALRVRKEDAGVASRSTGKEHRQLSLEIEQIKTPKAPQKDDLKKIHGIGPVIERALNKMGTHTYVQIARWKPADIARIAHKLATLPDKIKRDNWIAGAKKQHKEKYGVRL